MLLASSLLRPLPTVRLLGRTVWSVTCEGQNPEIVRGSSHKATICAQAWALLNRKMRPEVKKMRERVWCR